MTNYTIKVITSGNEYNYNVQGTSSAKAYARDKYLKHQTEDILTITVNDYVFYSVGSKFGGVGRKCNKL